jgi:hypothetical protein
MMDAVSRAHVHGGWTATGASAEAGAPTRGDEPAAQRSPPGAGP